MWLCDGTSLLLLLVPHIHVSGARLNHAFEALQRSEVDDCRIPNDTHTYTHKRATANKTRIDVEGIQQPECIFGGGGGDMSSVHDPYQQVKTLLRVVRISTRFLAHLSQNAMYEYVMALEANFLLSAFLKPSA